MTVGDIPRLLPVKLFLLSVPMATATDLPSGDQTGLDPPSHSGSVTVSIRFHETAAGLFLIRIPEVSTEFPAIGQSLQLWYPKAHFVIRNYHRMEN